MEILSVLLVYGLISVVAFWVMFWVVRTAVRAELDRWVTQQHVRTAV
jgi:hypothetical protein